MDRPTVEATEIIDPNWLAGFIDGEGCFYVDIFPAAGKTGFGVGLRFTITQHLSPCPYPVGNGNGRSDDSLMKKFIQSFGCGIFFGSQNKSVNKFRVSKFSDIDNKLIPFFSKYPLKGSKILDYQDFCKVATLMKVKAHLTNEGLEQIKKIKAGMNRGRK